MAQPSEFFLNKSVIKTGVVRRKDPFIEKSGQCVRDLLKTGGARHHVVVNSSQHGDPGGNRPARVHQTLKFIDDNTVSKMKNSYVNHVIVRGAAARGFGVDHAEINFSEPWFIHKDEKRPAKSPHFARV